MSLRLISLATNLITVHENSPVADHYLFSFLSTSPFKNISGYYLNTNGDTVHCEFKFKDWNITPQLLEVSANGKFITLTPVEIKGFGVYGYGDYISREINYHSGNYSPLNAPDVFSDLVTTRHSFLKRVAPGKYALYELVESSHTYFFVEEDDLIKELVYRVKKVGMDILEDDTYKKEIFAYFSKERLGAEYSTDITNLTYNSRSIVPLFRKLNEKISGVKYKPVRRDKTEFDVFLGAVDNTFPTSIGGRYSEANNKFDGSTSVSGGVSVVYFAPGQFRRVAIGASLAYNSYNRAFIREDSIVNFTSIYNNRTTKYVEVFSMKNHLLMLDLFGMYFVNPLNKVKVYVKGGFNTNIGLNSRNEIYVDYASRTTGVRNGTIAIDDSETGQVIIATRKLYFNIHGGLGLNSGKHKVEFNYYTPGVMNVNLLFKVKMMSVYYYFTLSK
ncbi:MAG: hypothetical protein JNK79_10680 [Chitinophagaceae bacterium]|nr:hypothetical protein [Chitinophagaceae bacterium]